MKVFRIEHNLSGFGPYYETYKDPERKIMLDRHNANPECYPLAQEDGIRLTSTKLFSYRYGFNSLCQLLSWFSVDELKMLYDVDFSCVEYEINKEDIIQGNKQIVFDPEKAERVQSLPFKIIEDFSCIY